MASIYPLFDINSKLSDMVTARPSLLHTLPMFGIALGFGDRRVRDVCSACDVDPQFFLLVCNIYALDEYIPDHEVILSTDMNGLVPYLKKCHDYYLNRRLPHIEQHLVRIIERLPDGVAKALRDFFNVYKNEVVKHFQFEENNVYPHIVKLLGRQNDRSYSIEHFLAQHDNLQDKLDDLNQILFKYLPEKIYDDDTLDVMFDIFDLSNDLKKHSLIEEKVLVPMVEFLEKTMQ